MKLICIWSPKGGTGKTTISLHLADCLSREGESVLVYDSDSQKSLTEVHKHSDEMSFDVTSSSPESVDGYDYVLVDFPPTVEGLTSEHKTMLKRAHKVVSPVRASRLDLMSFKSVSKAVDEERLISVLNAYDKRIKDQVDVYKEIAKEFVILSYASIYSRSINSCKTIFSESINRYHGVSKARNEMKKLAEFVK
jgi:chromosome partitioning protein